MRFLAVSTGQWTIALCYATDSLSVGSLDRERDRKTGYIIAQNRETKFCNVLKLSLALHGHVANLFSKLQPFEEKVFDSEHVIEELIKLCW